MQSKFIKGKLGKDGQDENWGGNILKDYKSREMDFGNETAQGVVTDITYASLKGSYMLKHNLFIDGKYIYRVVESEDNTFNSKNNIFSVALRLNIASRNHEF